MLIKELKSLALDIKVLDRDKNEIIIRELDDDDLDMDTTPAARPDEEGGESDQPAAAQEDGKPEAAEDDVEVDFSMDDELDDFDMDLGDDDLAAIDLDDEDDKPKDGE